MNATDTIVTMAFMDEAISCTMSYMDGRMGSRTTFDAAARQQVEAQLSAASEAMSHSP